MNTFRNTGRRAGMVPMKSMGRASRSMEHPRGVSPVVRELGDPAPLMLPWAFYLAVVAFAAGALTAILITH